MTSGFLPKLGGSGYVPYPWDTDGQAQQNETPTSGSTVVTPDDQQSGFLLVDGVGTLAALTVELPADAQSLLGQRRQIVALRAITALTVTQKGGSGVFLGLPVGLAANATLTLMKIKANTWINVT